MASLSLEQTLSSWLVTYLTGEVPAQTRRVPADFGRLSSQIRPGDVLLVEGRTRISQVIKYLTQSSWSHSAIYVGDALLRWGGAEAQAALRRWGPEAAQLLVESDLREGVIVVPLSKYRDHNLRLCRPHALPGEVLEKVLGEIFRHLGFRYDRRNILDLARYLTPFHLLPQRFRRKTLYLGSSGSREVICSALIAKAFYKAGFPIQPESGAIAGPGGRSLVQRHPSFIMPRDFDLSVQFEILKPYPSGGA
ncbi:MAG: lipo-like protein [Acidobacteria bacterium]|nr:lipo-like protein [Acidobacteriota bacterium]